MIKNKPIAAIQHRKREHVDICLGKHSQFDQLTSGFERYHFAHNCLPELNYDEISLDTLFLEKQLQAPLLISSMTGGTDQAKEINIRLATIAQEFGIAMGVAH